MPEMSKAVASMVATIEIDKNDILQQVLNRLSEAQKVVDGNTIKLQLAGDKKQIASEVEKIKSMLPEIGATIRLDMATSDIQKQMKSVKRYVGKSISEVEKTLKTNSGKLNLNKIIADQLKIDEKDINTKAVKEALIKLQSQVKGFDLSKATNTAQIEEYVSALQSMQTIIKEISKNGSKFADITSIGRGGARIDLKDLQKQVNSQLKSAMDQGSKIIAANSDTWANQIESSFNEAMSVAKHNLEVMANAMNELQKIGGSGNGTGTGIGEGIGDAKDEASMLEEELKNVSKSLSEINQKLGNNQTGNTIDNLKDSVTALNEELAQTKESVNSIKEGITVNKDKFRSDLQDAIKEPLDLTINPKIDENAKPVDLKVNPIVDKQEKAIDLEVNPILEDGNSAKETIQIQLNTGDKVKVDVEPRVNPTEFAEKIENALKDQSVQVKVEGLVDKVVADKNVKVETKTTDNASSSVKKETSNKQVDTLDEIISKESQIVSKVEEISKEDKKRQAVLQSEKDMLDGTVAKKQIEAEIAKEESKYDEASSSEKQRQADLQKVLANAKSMSSEQAKEELETLRKQRDEIQEQLKLAEAETKIKKEAFEKADDAVSHAANGRLIAVKATAQENYSTALEAQKERVRLLKEAKKLEEGSPERIELQEKAYRQLNKAALNYQQYANKTAKLLGGDAVKYLGGNEKVSKKLLAQNSIANQDFSNLQKTAGDLKVAWEEANEAENKLRSQFNQINADIDAQKKAVDRLVASEEKLSKAQQKTTTSKKDKKDDSAQKLYEEANGQLAFVEGLERTAQVENVVQQEQAETNAQIEGQITLEQELLRLEQERASLNKNNNPNTVQGSNTVVPTTIDSEELRNKINSALSKPFKVNLNPKTDVFIKTIKERLNNANFKVDIKSLSDANVNANVKVHSNKEDFEGLNSIIETVKNSIRTKTEAVILEEKTVTSSVGKEISAFTKLNEKLAEIKSNLEEMSKIVLPTIKIANITDPDKTGTIQDIVYEEVKKTSEEYQRILDFAKKYKGELGEIATIYKNVHQDSKGKDLISYKVTDVNGNSQTLNPQGGVVGSRIKAYDIANSEKEIELQKELLRLDEEEYDRETKIQELRDSGEQQQEEIARKNQEYINYWNERLDLEDKENKIINESWDEANKINKALNGTKSTLDSLNKDLNETKAILSSLSQKKGLELHFSELSEEQIPRLNKQLTSGEITLSEYKKSIEKLFSSYSNIISITEIKELEKEFSTVNSKVAELNTQLKNGDISVDKYSSSVKTLVSDYKALFEIQQKRDVEMYNKSASDKKSTQDSVDKALKDQVNYLTKIQSLRKDIKGASNPEEISVLKQVQKYYQEQYKEAGKILKANESLYNKELHIAELERIRLKTNSEINKKIDEANSKKNKQDNILSNQSKNWTVELSRYMRTNKGFNLTADDLVDSAGFDNLKNQISDIFKKTQNGSVKTKEDLDNLKVSFNELKEEIASITNSDNLKVNKNGVLLGDFTIDPLKDYEAQLRAVANAELQGSIVSSHYDIETERLIVTTKSGRNSFQDYAFSVDTANNSVRKLATTSKQTKGILQSVAEGMQGKFAEVFRYFGSFGVIYKGIEALRSGVQVIREMDAAMTELAKTSDATIKQLASFEEESFKIATRVGSTAVEVTNAASAWTRLGESIEDATKLSELTVLLKNVSEFDSIEDASSALVSIKQGFKLNTDEIKKAIDELNFLGNTTSSSTEELAQGLQNSAAALQVNGNNLEQTLALLVSANSQIQDISKSSNGLRTVALRLSGSSYEDITSQLSDMDEETDNVVKTTAKLEEEVKSLTAVAGKDGISLLDDNGNFRSTYEILLDIARVWEDIGKQDKLDGQNRQQTLLTDLAGKKFCQYVQKCA